MSGTGEPFDAWLARCGLCAPFRGDTFAIVRKARPRIVDGKALHVSVHFDNFGHDAQGALRILENG